jgi:YgiT-type zinc finger domain-containing protein
MATLPFVVKGSIVIVKGVRGEVCADCGEAFMSGRVTDAVTALVQDALRQRLEVAVVTLSDLEPLPA